MPLKRLLSTIVVIGVWSVPFAVVIVVDIAVGVLLAAYYLYRTLKHSTYDRATKSSMGSVPGETSKIRKKTA